MSERKAGDTVYYADLTIDYDVRFNADVVKMEVATWEHLGLKPRPGCTPVVNAESRFYAEDGLLFDTELGAVDSLYRRCRHHQQLACAMANQLFDRSHEVKGEAK
jgi:hypothetical protein